MDIPPRKKAPPHYSGRTLIRYDYGGEVSALKSWKIVLAFCLAAVTARPGFAQEAAFRAAEVYPRGALVTVEAPAKPDMTFDLPLAFEEESIRVSGTGARILSVETGRSQRPGWIPGSLRELAARLAESRSRVDRLEALSASLQQTVKHLQDPVPGSWKPQDLAAFLDSAARKREQVEQRARENARALEKARAETERLERELSGKLPPDPDTALRIQVRTSGTGTVRLQLWTPHASWSTRYALDLASKTGRVNFAQQAVIQQKTGLDWSGRIVLHTVQPRRTMAAPDLRPLVADFERETARNIEGMMLKEAAAPDETKAPVQEETLTDVSLETRGSATGDGTPSKIPVAGFGLPSKALVVAIPALDREAWLTAEIEKLDRPLLAGSAELFLDGSPSGRAFIGMTGRGESLKLAFGRVPLVTAVLEEAVPQEGTTWGRGKLEKSFTLSVTNGSGTATDVTVLDRVPVSAQDKIKVEVLSIEPKPARRDDRGILAWEVRLAPGETKKFSLKYRLTYPADRRIIFRGI
jgi:hypothetical protein